MDKKLSISKENEWLIFAEPAGQELLQLLIKPLETARIQEIFPTVLSRVETLYKKSVTVLDAAPLTLLLVSMRKKQYTEAEILLCKNIEELGKDEGSAIYECISLKRRKLQNEGWLYYAVKDIAGNRKKEAKKLAKELLHALWEDVKTFGLYWNALYNYKFSSTVETV